MNKNIIKIYLFDTPLGHLYIENTNGKEIYSFEYDSSWLKSNANFKFDPEIEPYIGRQYPSKTNKLFGAFCDCSPDRWGKMLIRRREQNKAIQENRKAGNLTEIDYLLKVSDFARPGAFRFSLDNGATFKSNNKQEIPPIKFIRELQNASLNLKQNDEFLNMLLAPGSSLGGARPKANVIDTEKNLWIAKFPTKQDEIDIEAWEMVAYKLAEMSDINVPKTKLLKLSHYGSTLLIKRFDRNKNTRIHFASAMTMLNKNDGDGAAEGVSYLDIASWIMANCKNSKQNMIELFKRVVFNCAISNYDDHLRNHAFIYKKGNWELSPAYDLNPVPYGNMLSLNITEDNNIASKENLIKSSIYYGLSETESVSVIDKIEKTVSKNWRLLAKNYKISPSSIEYMSNCFETQ